MPLTAYLPESIALPDRLLEGHALITDAGRIKAVIPAKDVPVMAERIRLDGLTLAAGLVDAQVNGGGGILFNDAPGSLPTIVKAHRDHGTAAFLPTLISDNLKKIPEAIDAIKEFCRKHGEDAGVAGLHLEGPFLNPERKGIHPEAALQRGSAEALLNIDTKNLGTLLVTLAPENVTPADIKILAARGIIIAAGHSAVDAETLNAAKAAGLKGVTHLYNAMGPMNARAPGLAGLALGDDDLWCSLICDDAHVDAAMVRLALKAKPENKLFLVSDAMPPAGQSPPQNFNLLGEKIFVKNGRCENSEGRLAGCALTLFECVSIAVQKIGIPLPRALAMASLYPAKCLGLADYGSLEPGKRAAFIAFDRNMKLEKTFYSF